MNSRAYRVTFIRKGQKVRSVNYDSRSVAMDQIDSWELNGRIHECTMISPDGSFEYQTAGARAERAA